MKINNEGVQPVSEAQGVKAKGKVSRVGGAGQVGDAVSVSASSQDISKALAAIAGTPDVRADKVAQLAASVSDGTFQAGGSSIVDALFGGPEA